MRALLQVDVAAFVDDEDVHRPVQQLACMDFSSRELAGHLIVLVHHVEHLARLLSRIDLAALLVVASDVNPLRE